jgi:hypothetical protein
MDSGEMWGKTRPHVVVESRVSPRQKRRGRRQLREPAEERVHWWQWRTVAMACSRRGKRGGFYRWSVAERQ